LTGLQERGAVAGRGRAVEPVPRDREGLRDPDRWRLL